MSLHRVSIQIYNEYNSLLAISDWDASHANQSMDLFLFSVAGLASWHPLEIEAALICNLPGSLQQRKQSLSNQAYPPAKGWSALARWPGKLAQLLPSVFILKKYARSSYESGNFIQINFPLCFFFPTKCDPGRICILYKRLPKFISASLDLMAFDEDNVPLLYSYSVQTQKAALCLMLLKLNINDLNVNKKVVCVYGKCLLIKSAPVRVNSDYPSMHKNNWGIKLGTMFSGNNEKIIFLWSV